MQISPVSVLRFVVPILNPGSSFLIFAKAMGIVFLICSSLCGG